MVLNHLFSYSFLHFNILRYQKVLNIQKSVGICFCNSRFMEEKLKSVQNVSIDQGTFKYILIKVYDPENEETGKFIVRGLCSAGYHGDIYDEVTPAIEKLGLECECTGGGRIQHNPDEKTIHVYGYSQGYGRADHAVACQILNEHYPEYKKIDFANDGY